MSELRLYDALEIGRDGYPAEWHETIKHQVREDAGHRCVRCLHPYRRGEHGRGEWTPCDERCSHVGPMRVTTPEGEKLIEDIRAVPGEYRPPEILDAFPDCTLEARWRILTVHHLDGDKANCRWWNLVALCQRCHLTIQGRVQMARVWPWEHSDWFKPYVAGFYAFSYLGEDLTREETMARLDELLSLELVS